MILHEKLKMWKVADCWVSHVLNREQRGHCIEICSEWLKRIEDELGIMGLVITGDESWIHHFDPATKQEGMH